MTIPIMQNFVKQTPPITRDYINLFLVAAARDVQEVTKVDFGANSQINAQNLSVERILDVLVNKTKRGGRTETRRFLNVILKADKIQLRIQKIHLAKLIAGLMNRDFVAPFTMYDSVLEYVQHKTKLTGTTDLMIGENDARNQLLGMPEKAKTEEEKYELKAAIAYFSLMKKA